MSKPSSAAEEESRATIAHNLARLIFEQKRQRIQEDPNFKLKSKLEQEEMLSFKTDTYLSMEKMIENIKKYREEYTGNRTQLFSNKDNKRELILKKMSSWLRKKTNPCTKPESIPSAKTVEARARARS